MTTSEAAGISGLVLIPEFVTEEEERALVLDCDARPWQEMAKRRVQHQGFRWALHGERGLVG